MILFLDFDGVLHPSWELIDSGWHRAYVGPFFVHAPALVELLRSYSASIEVVISSTWGRNRDLDTLRGLLPSELAERVTDAVHHRLPPLEDFQRGHDLTSRWAEIAFYREHMRPDIGDLWLAIDDDDVGWPDEERNHLAYCAHDLGCAATREEVAKAIGSWLIPKGPLVPPQ